MSLRKNYKNYKGKDLVLKQGRFQKNLQILMATRQLKHSKIRLS
jgi:hypothetical protein